MFFMELKKIEKPEREKKNVKIICMIFILPARQKWHIVIAFPDEINFVEFSVG